MSRPTMLIEVWDSHRTSIDQFLSPLGYRYEDADSGGAADLPPYNAIAIPLSDAR